MSKNFTKQIEDYKSDVLSFGEVISRTQYAE